jgi:hypothetical protein
MQSTSGRPLSGAWRDAALHVIGEGTLYRPSSSLPTDQIIRPTFKLAQWRESGYRPETAPIDAWILDATLSHLGVRRSQARNLEIYLDFVDDLSAYRLASQIEAALRDLVAEGLLTCSGGKWALTAEGTAKSVNLRHLYTTTNVTSYWISRRVDDDYIGRLVATLTQWCPRSAQFGELEDLINGYFANIVRRDGFRKRIAQVRQPAFSDVKQWVYNAALSTWRDEGRDAQTRAFKGARTEKDLRQENDDDVATRSVATDAQAIFLVTDGDGDTGTMASSGGLPMPLVDVLGGDLEDEMIHALTWRRGMERAVAVVRKAKAGAPDRFDRLLREVAEGGANVQDIEEAEGVSRNRAGTLVTSLRTVLDRERDLAGLAVRVFGYLKKNPFSTLADMESPVDDDPDAVDGGLGEVVPVSLLDNLVAAGRLKRTGSGAATCYCLTQAGERALFDGDYFGVDLDIHKPSHGVGSGSSVRV